MTTATYSPSDNKIRIYPETRLDAETYKRVRDAGFAWAPKQELFVCPRWTPAAEDMAIELAGDIEDEDMTPAERADARAERFESYEGKRKAEAEQARKAVSAIADNIPFGQPILVGHHSERHARRDAEKIENGMRRTIKLFETAAYWKDRAQSAIAHAKYLELPAVRARRIKTIEADKRKREREKEEAQALVRFWSGETFVVNRATGEKRKLDINEESRELLCRLLGNMRASGVSFRGIDGTLWYSAWDCLCPEAERYKNCPAKTVTEVQEAVLRIQAAVVANCDRWIAHLENRLVYERTMLDQNGGLKADKFDLQPGGQVLRRGKWCIITKVNRTDSAIRSVTVLGHFASTIQVEDIADYRPPAEGMAEKVKAATKLPPMCNYPGEGFRHLTSAEWDQHKRISDVRHSVVHKANENHGTHRTRATHGPNWSSVSVYVIDAKRVDPPAPSAEPQPTKLETLPPERRSVPRETPPADPFAADLAAMKATLKAGVQVIAAPQLFPTPPDLAARMVELADLKPGLTVLEPSAGTGNIANPIRSTGAAVVCVEINPILAKTLSDAGHAVHLADFLQWEPASAVQEVASRASRIPSEEIARGDEIWKPVVGYETVYEVSSWGRIRRLVTVKGRNAGDFVNGGKRADGYINIMLCKGGEATSRLMHQIVMDAFVGPCPEGMEINHRHPDGDKSRNWLSNLEYTTSPENNRDQIERRPSNYNRGDVHPRSKLTRSQIPGIKERIRSGEDSASIAEAFGVTAGTISAIASGKTWRDPLLFDRVIANPPFVNGADCAHIRHALTFLRQGGRLVAICANGPRQQAELRPLATTWEELPEGTFAAQGTNVRTVLLTIDA